MHEASDNRNAGRGRCGPSWRSPKLAGAPRFATAINGQHLLRVNHIPNEAQ